MLPNHGTYGSLWIIVDYIKIMTKIVSHKLCAETFSLFNFPNFTEFVEYILDG